MRTPDGYLLTTGASTSWSGRIIGFGGLAVREMPHRFKVDGRTLYTGARGTVSSSPASSTGRPKWNLLPPGARLAFVSGSPRTESRTSSPGALSCRFSCRAPRRFRQTSWRRCRASATTSSSPRRGDCCGLDEKPSRHHGDLGVRCLRARPPDSCRAMAPCSQEAVTRRSLCRTPASSDGKATCGSNGGNNGAVAG